MTQGTCPCCGSDNLNYDTIDFEGDQCYYPRECLDCHARGEERYVMEFSGHENIIDKDGNEVLFNDNK